MFQIVIAEKIEQTSYAGHMQWVFSFPFTWTVEKLHGKIFADISLRKSYNVISRQF